jgi:hypothetical protein
MRAFATDFIRRTSPADLAMMKNLLPEESLKEMGDIMLALFLQLQEPGEHDEEGASFWKIS